MQMRKVFVFTRKKPYVKQIPFKNLRTGSIFYTEEPDGELSVDDLKNGKIAFLYRCMTHARLSGKGRLKVWGVSVDPAELNECLI